MEINIFSMKGCPHCDNLKNKLKENNIEFVEIDINENELLYERFSKKVNNEKENTLFFFNFNSTKEFKLKSICKQLFIKLTISYWLIGQVMPMRKKLNSSFELFKTCFAKIL